VEERKAFYELKVVVFNFLGELGSDFLMAVLDSWESSARIFLVD
jgi:hypothetical protein